MKNKQKILWAFEKSKVTAKWKKLQTGAYDDVDQTVFKWFTSKRGQQIPINGSMLEGKAIDFEKARNKSNFKASHGLERKTGFAKISSFLFLLDNIRMYFYNFFSKASI